MDMDMDKDKDVDMDMDVDMLCDIPAQRPRYLVTYSLKIEKCSKSQRLIMT